ncbi:predicted protein [Histoplasma mississippiense (nom. inval.)]|uniref:predicted protein n=1 Tax=Ajellomyces capsulatus (strain NAm1 / WU24) TaxID=2059318 RepID=UPI000157C580|nr:predicted protein [Histoplasma mississippiense (nom. inval.)]EDN08555.1 predicted protein [Histoplasma mississippiense (nom. inval.)]
MRAFEWLFAEFARGSTGEANGVELEGSADDELVRLATEMGECADDGDDPEGE